MLRNVLFAMSAVVALTVAANAASVPAPTTEARTKQTALAAETKVPAASADAAKAPAAPADAAKASVPADAKAPAAPHEETKKEEAKKS